MPRGHYRRPDNYPLPTLCAILAELILGTYHADIASAFGISPQVVWKIAHRYGIRRYRNHIHDKSSNRHDSPDRRGTSVDHHQ